MVKISSLKAVSLMGLQPIEVKVEVSIQRGLPNMQIVGLPDAAIKESKERVRSALASIGQKMPRGHVTVSLAPAEVKKIGSSFDLPIALGLLLAEGAIKPLDQSLCFIGELGLDGSIRPVRGALPIAIGLKNMGFSKCYASQPDAALLAHVEGMSVIGVPTLAQLIDRLERGRGLDLDQTPQKIPQTKSPQYLLDDLVGMETAKEALIMAAAGGHHMLMTGPPGTGKTALAKCLGSLLPLLNKNEQLEVNSISSLAGPITGGWQSLPPWRAPHHSSSAASLMGGGHGLVPGEISLAHCGVLFLDELPEFRRDVLEQLRQPLEEGQIRLARANLKLNYPARFQLIAASNPCPCGFYGDRVKACSCSPAVLSRYQNKLSGPILDRIELKIWVPRSELSGATTVLSKNSGRSEHDAAIGHIKRARERQLNRAKLKKLSSIKNSELTGPQIRRLVPLNNKMRTLLAKAESELGLSPRGFIKTLKVARTIADLADLEVVDERHIAKALQFRV